MLLSWLNRFCSYFALYRTCNHRKKKIKPKYETWYLSSYFQLRKMLLHTTDLLPTLMTSLRSFCQSLQSFLFPFMIHRKQLFSHTVKYSSWRFNWMWMYILWSAPFFVHILDRLVIWMNFSIFQQMLLLICKIVNNSLLQPEILRLRHVWYGTLILVQYWHFNWY